MDSPWLEPKLKAIGMEAAFTHAAPHTSPVWGMVANPYGNEVVPKDPRIGIDGGCISWQRLALVWLASFRKKKTNAHTHTLASSLSTGQLPNIFSWQRSEPCIDSGYSRGRGQFWSSWPKRTGMRKQPRLLMSGCIIFECAPFDTQKGIL